MTAQGFTREHWKDSTGNPAGGCTTGKGFTISWQNGPLGRGRERKPPNGAFVEDVIAAARDRIEFYQGSQFSCDENTQAILHLTSALECLDARTKRREEHGTEGTHLVEAEEGQRPA